MTDFAISEIFEPGEFTLEQKLKAIKRSKNQIHKMQKGRSALDFMHNMYEISELLYWINQDERLNLSNKQYFVLGIAGTWKSIGEGPNAVYGVIDASDMEFISKSNSVALEVMLNPMEEF